MSVSLLIAALSLAIWVYLLFARGGFWRAAERDDLSASPQPADVVAAVTAVIPARNEADVVGRAVASLLSQRPALDIVLVNDQSSDGTAEAADGAAAELGASNRLAVLSGRPLPPGWTGKLWALQQGIDHVLARSAPAEFLLLSDADIAYAPDSIAALVAEARASGLVLNSRMAKLCGTNPAERALIPAFIFFFQMLYPFAWVNQPTRAIAAAAGGCMLLRREALLAAGGIESIRGELIDDCALARRMKPKGPIRLMLTERVRSLRPYAGIGEIRRMVARSAYAQLRYSPLLLLGTAAGSCSASQRSLVTVNEAVGTLPVCRAHHSGPPISVVSAAACGAERTSFQSRAGLITWPRLSTTTMPCCCAATPIASARSSSPSPARARAFHHSSGSHSVPSGCGAAPCPTMAPSSAWHSSTLVD